MVVQLKNLKMSSKRKVLLSRECVEKEFWEPYIINGYRRTDTSLWQCIKYMFILHNDFGNFWTHFIPLWIWLYWLYRLSFQLDLTDPYWYPLLVMWIGSCCYLLCSSTSHGFSIMSKNILEILCMIDYHGISLYTLGYAISFYFYECPLGHWLFEYKSYFVALCVVLTIMSTLLTCLSRFYWEKQRYVVRVMSYMLPYQVANCSLYAKFYTCHMTNTQCLPNTLLFHWIALGMEFLLAFIYASKIPERYFPGRFDYIGQSHQVFHIISATGTSLVLYLLYKDALERHREMLLQDPSHRPDLYSTLMPFVVTLVGGSAIIIGLYILTYRQYLLSNRTASKLKEK